MADEKKEDELPIVFEKPLRYYGADEVVGTFADQVMVSHSTGTFTLMFYQMQTAEVTDAEAIMARPDIPTKCVAKIVLPPQLVEAFYNAIGSNLEKQKKMAEIIKTYSEKRSGE